MVSVIFDTGALRVTRTTIITLGSLSNDEDDAEDDA